jgi:hypothetical protein
VGLPDELPPHDDLPPRLREGFDSLDAVNAAKREIKQLQADVDSLLASYQAMREHLPPELQSNFEVLVQKGGMPVINAMRTNVKNYQRVIEGWERDARDAAND